MGLEITKKDHLKKVKCKIEGVDADAIIWSCDINESFYLIQNVKDGKCSIGSIWKKYGKFTWLFYPSDLKATSVKILKIYSKENNYELWD